MPLATALKLTDASLADEPLVTTEQTLSNIANMNYLFDLGYKFDVSKD